MSALPPGPNPNLNPNINLNAANTPQDPSLIPANSTEDEPFNIMKEKLGEMVKKSVENVIDKTF